MKLFKTVILYISISFFYNISAQTLLKDIATGNGNSVNNQSKGLEIDNKLYFEAMETTVNELWVTDLTTNVTTKVLSNQNAPLSNLENFMGINGLLIFISQNELYRSDGTTSGTYKLNRRFVNYTSLRSVVYNNVLYFTQSEGVYGEELWATDGTINGTYLVKDIAIGSGSSSPNNFFVYNGFLFFSAYTTAEGRELWKTDGTTVNTVLVKDINSGTSDSNPSSYTILNNNLYLTALIGGNNTLIKTDGTTQGTVAVTSNVSITNLQVYNNMFVFQSGGALWKSDGITQTKFYTALGKINRFAVHNNRIYFILYYDPRYYTTLPNYKVGLFTSDATTAGTIDIKTLSSANVDVDRIAFIDAGNFANLAGISYFLFSDPIAGDKLWRTDGTTQGTKLVKNMNYTTNGNILKNLVVSNSKLFYSCRDSTEKLHDILISDGTSNGTSYLRAKNPLKNLSITEILLKTSNYLIFRAYHPIYGFELWKTQSNIDDAILIKDVNQVSPQSSNPNGSFFVNNKMIFRANDIEHGEELWVTDGTQQGTQLYFDCTPKFSTSIGTESNTGIGTIFSCFKVFKNNLYFFSNYNELWKADGINQPVKLKQFSPNTSPSRCKMVEMGGNLYFIWDYTLWKCDGQNVTIVKSIGLSDYFTITSFNNKVYFFNSNYSGGNIWASDGTPSGTTSIASLGAYGRILDFAVSQGYLYLVIANGLYKTDGISPSLTFVADMGYSSNILMKNYETSLYETRTIFPVNNKILFWGGSYANNNNGLWRSNGTTTGTVLVSSMPWNIFEDVTVAGNYLYYNFQGQTIDRSDGTAAGTTTVWNGKYMIKGPDGSLYSQRRDANLITQLYRNEPNGTFTKLTNLTLDDNATSQFISIWGGRLYHATNTTDYGRELYYVNLPCQNSLTLTDPNENILEGVNLSYKTSGTITAVNKIDTNTFVNYTSESMIELKTGFDVKNGSVFTVETKGCNN